MNFARTIILFISVLGWMLSLASGATNLEPPQQPIPRTLFGMHVPYLPDGTFWPSVSVPTSRLWDSQVKWPDLEPTKGQWHFATLDKYVDLAQQHNTEILLPLGTTPQWASALPNVKSGWQAAGLTAPPDDMNEWRTYVRQVVSRYKGRIFAYEIWNEPNLKQFWIGDTDQLVAMTKDAQEVIKSIDPAAILVSPSATTGAGIAWLSSFLGKGGGRYVDVIGYHFYVYPQSPEAILPLIGRVKQTMKDYGVEDKPIWDTEIGWAAPKPFPSDELAAGYLARSYILSWAAGVRRVYWYSWTGDEHSWASIMTTGADFKGLRPAGEAFGTIQKWLVGNSMSGCNESVGQIWTCQLHHGEGSQWIVWTLDSSGKNFPVPSSWHAQSYTPLLGGSKAVEGSSVPISQVPILLVSVPNTLATSGVHSSAIPSTRPNFIPLGGTYSVGQQIILGSSTPAAVMHYVDGSQASVNSTEYRTPLALTKGETVRSIAFAGEATSNEESVTFAASRPEEPRYSPPGGTYLIGQQITLSSSTPGAIIHYTIDGSQASVNSAAYKSPLVLTKGEIIRAIAAVGNVSSFEASAAFAVTSSASIPEEPRYSPPGGTYLIGQQITLSSSTSDAVIHYTVDGSQASVNSPVYQTPLVLIEGEVIRAMAFVGSVSSYEASATFSVGYPSAIPASLFGLTVLDFTKLSPSISFGTTRSWDAYPNLDWSDANPSRGVYNFDNLDKFIAVNQARGSEIIYTLGRTPQWASSEPNAPGPYGPGQCAPPADIDDYENYLRAIVTRADGRIKYWELWNEPQDVHFYCGDIPNMVRMANSAAKVIKEIDPAALILSPGVTGGPGPSWLSSFLSDGGAEYVDIIAFHGYWNANAEDIASVISSYRAVMVAKGVAEKPLWDTESSWAGFGNIGTPNNSQQIGFIAKDYLLHCSMGVPRFVWYAYDGGTIWGGLWNSRTGESSAAKSYSEIYRWMVGAALTAPCSANQEGIWTCNLSRPGGYLAEAVWISNKTAAFVVPPNYTEYLDLAGAVHTITSSTITVGDQPILLENRNLP
jgi:Chitobiase/beta-hexosaminidase C-terminal domain/Glycosyl hydrolases family 39